MPSSILEKNGSTSQGYPLNYYRRTRSWSNMTGRRTTPEWNWPINTYSDVTVNPHQKLGNSGVFTKPSGPWSYSPVGYSSTGALVDRHSGLSAWLSGFEKRSDSELRNQAVIKALGKVSDSKANLAVSAKEASKTSDLILGKAKSIYESYRAFRKGDLKGVAKHLNLSPKTAHKSWLEYKYGWSPLLMEVKGAAEFLAQSHLGGRPPRFTVSASVKDEVSAMRKVYDPSFSPGSYWVETAERSRIHKIKIWCEVENPRFNEMQQLGLTNPLLYAWEVVPFSFVFDWFVGVGDYLTGLTALHGITVVKAMHSRLAEFACGYNSIAAPYDNSLRVATGYNFHFYSSGRSYDRSSTALNPTETYPPVDWTPFSWNRLTSGLALIRAQGKRLG